MKLTIHLSDKLEAALKEKANAQGLTADGFVCQILERELAPFMEEPKGPPFKTGRGLFAKYGLAPSSEQIDANRAEMFGRFAEDKQGKPNHS